MKSNFKGLVIACAAGVLATGAANAAPCAEGQSEAVLVTSRGSITMCVDEDLAIQGGALEVQTVECPCAPYVPDPREWRRLSDSRECTNTASGVLVEAMSDKSGGKLPKKEIWSFLAGVAGEQCSFQIAINGVTRQSNRYLVPSQAAADACRTFAEHLFTSFASTKRETAACPAP
jgi:hypothetical protein